MITPPIASVVLKEHFSRPMRVVLTATSAIAYP